MTSLHTSGPGSAAEAAPDPAGAPADAVEIVAALQRAFDERDVDRIMATMTDDCVFEDTTPPDGQRHRGASAVRRRWEQLFVDAPRARFETEEIIPAGERVVVLWCYRWGEGHVRGVDVFRVRDDRVAEKLSYVKG